MAKRTRVSKQLRPLVGDLVLFGSYASAPGEWQLAKVLWAGPEDFLSEHSYGGEVYRQVLSYGYVRAIGPLSRLLAYQRKAAAEVRGKVREIHVLESALGEARNECWTLVEQIRAPGLRLGGAPAQEKSQELDRLSDLDIVAVLEEARETVATGLTELAAGFSSDGDIEKIDERWAYEEAKRFEGLVGRIEAILGVIKRDEAEHG